MLNGPSGNAPSAMVRRSVNRLLVGFLLASLAGVFAACQPEPPPPPRETSNPPLAHHVLIASIDGCRPDVLLRAELEAQQKGEHPIIADLMAHGSFTFWARTIKEAVTLPSHTSMVTGVNAQVHDITWNEVKGTNFIYPSVPTLFDIAKQHGLTTSIFSNKYKFRTFCKPGAIDWGYITPEDMWVEDAVIGATAADVVVKHKPNVIFVHLGTTDLVGHAKYPDADTMQEGWGSPLQMQAIEKADAAIKQVVTALKVAGIYDDTMIIITADHGGAGTSHGPDDPRSRFIPWICVGPHVRENYDLTRDRNLWIDTEDTFATASYFLGLPIAQDVQGRPVTEVLQKPETLSPG